MGTILIIDDDPQLRYSFEKLLSRKGHKVQTAPTGEAGIDMIRSMNPDLVISDVRLPGMSGLELFRAVHGIWPKLPVIIMTAYGTTDTAIEATKLGAFDYVLKPFEIPDMLSLIDQALDTASSMRSQQEMKDVPAIPSHDAIGGHSRAMQDVYKAIGRVAPTDATVLIRGESGTGKELVAKAIHQHSLRSERPYVVINCVAIPDTLLESELFGYEKGAFTGAPSRRVGRIEQGSGGTVFLDEIGDMPLSIQAKILRLLQEKTIERLGGNEAIKADVRILAATNRDLETAVARGEFRKDLYYRLNVVTIALPPLRERDDDIDLLADMFLARYSRQMGMPNPGMNEEVRAVLRTYSWPGNVRELGNLVQMALIFSRGSVITLENKFLQAIRDTSHGQKRESELSQETMRHYVRSTLQSNEEKDLFASLIDHFSGIIISEALNLTGGNRSQAAKLLGLSRPTLLAKIEKYGITIEASAKMS
ncbi:MAG: sigma-54-dependent Fis family transcriptional regulator [Deltaproteobacteria bacterium]|nr:sigma-54-dependent Fis family transcriptional regulator [Deltaproteobacteria bacterium]